MPIRPDWALKRNRDFPDHSTQGGGGDCTNFLSQAMLAGGWQVSWGLKSDVRSWWSSQDESSHAWAAVDTFKWHIRFTSRAVACSRNELAIGDLVFVMQPRTDRALHGMIVTNVKQHAHRHPSAQNTVSLCGHTNDRLNYPLDAVIRAYDERNLEYWRVADVIPDKPLPAFNPGPPPPATLRETI